MESSRNSAKFSKKNSCLISGADLCKFYDRPIHINSKIGDTFEIDERSFIPYEPEVPNVNQFVSKSTQTDYRESETQTDPWDPPFIVTQVLEEPEVLSLSDFSFGNGLPASLLEVNYISELRRNKKFKAEVESSEHNELFEKKKQISCDQVKNEWNYKISVLNEKQLEKLNTMKSSLIDEMKKHSDKKEKFLSNLWTYKMTEMGKQNLKLQQKLRKDIHILETGVLNKEPNALENSDVYKRFPVKCTKTKVPISQGTEYMLSKYYLTDPSGLSSIKNWLESKSEGLKTEIPLISTFKRSQRERLAGQAYQDILQKKRSKLPPKIYREDYVKEEPPEPSVKAEDVMEFIDFEEKKVDLVTIWQKVLRGFAHQKQMFELIEHHKDGLSTILSPLYPGIAD